MKRRQVRIDVGISPDGKRIRKAFYGKTLTDARNNRDRWINEQKYAAGIDPDITMEQWSAIWLDSVKGLSENSTFKGKVTAVKRQNETLGSYRVRDLKPIHIQQYMTSLSGMSKSTISKRRYILKGILESAVANGIIQRSPWHNIIVPRGEYSGHRALTEDERAAIGEHWKECRAGAWAMLMVYTGLRKSELAGLEAKDYDREKHTLNIRQALNLKEHRVKDTKTAAGVRTVPVPRIVWECVPEKRSGYLFGSVNNETLSEWSIKRGWNTLTRITGVNFTPHDCRTTYATMLYEAGVDVKTAQYLLGHATLEMTLDIYTKLTREKQEAGVSRYLDYLDGHQNGHHMLIFNGETEPRE